MRKWQSHKYNFAKRHTRWVTAGMALALVLCFAISAHANVVFGQVFDENNNPKPDAAFTVKDSSGQVVKDVKTDKAGNYNVFLPKPGMYIAEFAAGKKVKILSQPEPVKQDIHLK